MELRQIIQNYKSFNMQEEKDKDMMLKYIDSFDDYLTRDNEYGHFVGGGFVVNKKRDKVLMIHHNIFDAWALPGGHADGDEDLLEVSLKEVKEETGIKNIKVLLDTPFIIDILPIAGYIKNGKYVSAHSHLSLIYLFEVNENEDLIVCEEENSDVRWIPIDKIIEQEAYIFMKDVYKKAIEKLRLLSNK